MATEADVSTCAPMLGMDVHRLLLEHGLMMAVAHSCLCVASPVSSWWLHGSGAVSLLHTGRMQRCPVQASPHLMVLCLLWLMPNEKLFDLWPRQG